MDNFNNTNKVDNASELTKKYFKKLLSDGKSHRYKEMCEYADNMFEMEKQKYSYLKIDKLSSGVKSRASMNLINKEKGDIRYTKVEDGIYQQYKFDEVVEYKPIDDVIKLKDNFIKKLRKELDKYNKIKNDKLTSCEFDAIQELKNIIRKLEN